MLTILFFIILATADFEEVDVGTDWPQQGDDWCAPTILWLNHGGDHLATVKKKMSMDDCLALCEEQDEELAGCNVAVYQAQPPLCQLFANVPTLKHMPAGFNGKRSTIAKLCGENCGGPDDCPDATPPPTEATMEPTAVTTEPTEYKGDEGDDCEEDSDCADGLFCNSANECAKDGSCVDLTDCEGGQICKDGECVEKGDEGDDCEADPDCKDGLFCNSANECAKEGDCVDLGDCKGGQLCKEGKCVDKGDEGDNCEEDPDCKDGLFCNSANECAKEGSCVGEDDCEGGQLCKDSVCVDKGDEGDDCEEDPDCKDGLFCNSANECGKGGSCVDLSDCEGEQLCKEGKCVDKGDDGDDCEEDPDCKDGLFCNSANECGKEGSCASVDDCEEGQLCKENKCVDKGEAGDDCEADSDCEDALFCNSASKCAPEGSCAGDADCEDGEACENNTCVKRGSCKTGRTGGACDTRHTTSWDGCNKCAYGYRWAGFNHWCCTQQDLQLHDDCICHCADDNSNFDACVCYPNGVGSGKCDRRKPVSEWNSCDRCQYGSRYAWPSHWCCTTGDVENHNDCICADGTYAAKRYGPRAQVRVQGAEAVVMGEETSLTVEDFALWLLAAVGLGFTVYASISAFTGTKEDPQETQPLV